MTKILAILFVGALALGACSKEKKINKKIDGSWTLVEENGAAISDESVTTITFNKDKKEGSGELTQKDDQGSSTTMFDYSLDNNILSTSMNNYTVTEFSKTDLTLLSTNGSNETEQKFTKN
ncbi:MAG: hypothetical protein ACI9XP_000275 [Lentimonas sp.]|jgi:hypothetical protein